MGRACAGRPELVAARLRLGLTQDLAAERIGVTRATFARWERGEQDVRAVYRRRLAEYFDVSCAEMEHWLGGERPTVKCDLGLAYQHSLTHTLDIVSELWRWDVDVARRRVLASLPFVPVALGDVLSGWRFDSPDAVAAGGGARRVGAGEVQRLHEARQAFTQMDHQFGGGLVRPAVVDYLDQQVTPLLKGSYTSQVGRELFAAAAGMARLAGWMSHDEQRHGLAQRHYVQALRLAKAGGDPLTAAHVLATMSQQAADLNHPDWATRMARAARDSGADADADASPRVMALLALREARGLALRVSLGDMADAHTVAEIDRLIAEAERRMSEAGSDDEEPAWVATFTEAEFTAEAGFCWLLSGDYERAGEAAGRALDGFSGGFQRSRLLNRTHVAEACLGQGDIDQALATAREAVPAAKALSSPRATARLASLPLEPYARETRVKEFKDYVRMELTVAA